MILTLSVQHNIYLTKEQRYALHAGQDIETVGVSVPIWFTKNLTSEPGKEVFCRYVIKNPKQEVPVKIREDGYEIVIPHREAKPKVEISNEDWRKMTEGQREDYYKKLGTRASSTNLLDISDGGSLCLMYREHNKVKINDQMVNIVHFVHIQDEVYLKDSVEIKADNHANS